MESPIWRLGEIGFMIEGMSEMTKEERRRWMLADLLRRGRELEARCSPEELAALKAAFGGSEISSITVDEFLGNPHLAESSVIHRAMAGIIRRGSRSSRRTSNFEETGIG